MKALKWTTPIGNIWQITYLLGNKNYHQAPQKGELALKETSGEKRRKRKESSPSNVHPINDFVLPAKAATATASHASDCTSTPEDAHLSTRWVLPP